MDAVYVDDGQFTIEGEGDQSCWLLPACPRAQYLYLDVASSFYKPGQGELEIEIEYLDAGQLRFGLEYDSADTTAALGGVYKAHAQLVQATGTGAWRKTTFRIADARFQGAQNAGADFRFFYMGDPFQVRRVVMRRVK